MDDKKQQQGASDNTRIDTVQSSSHNVTSETNAPQKSNSERSSEDLHHHSPKNDKVVTPPEHGESPLAPTSESRKGNSRNLIANLGFENWPHSDEALVQALAVKSEHERTKQEFFRFESHKCIMEIFKKAEILGVPGSALPAMFGINDEVAKSAFAAYADQRKGPEFSTPKQHIVQQQQHQQQQPQPSQKPQAPHLHKLSVQGAPVSQQQHIRQDSVYSSPSNVASTISGFPGPLVGPQSPIHNDPNATIPSPGALAPTSTPGNTSDFGTHTPLAHRSQGHPDFNTVNYSAGRKSPDKFVPGHRATVSAMPALGSSAQPLYLPNNTYLSQSPTPLVSPTVTNPYRSAIPSAGVGAPQYSVPHLLPPMDPQVQHALEQEQRSVQQQQAQQLQQAQQQAQQAQQAQVQADQQVHILNRDPGQFTPYTRTSQSTGVPQQTSLNTPTQPLQMPQQQQLPPQQPSSVQSSPNQPMVPVMGFTPAYRPSPTRRTHHRSSLSTGSDLQIHQWKPKQLLRDNRWKLANPFKAKERRAEEAAQAAASHQSNSSPSFPSHQSSDDHNNTARNQNGSGDESESASKAPPSKQASRGSDAGGSSPQRSAQDSNTSSSAAVVAAHNNRRRSANHVRRRSAAMFSPETSFNDTPSMAQTSEVHTSHAPQEQQHHQQPQPQQPQQQQQQPQQQQQQPQQQHQHQRDIARRDEGVAVLASLATEHGRRDSNNHQHPNLPSQSPINKLQGEPGPVQFGNSE